MKKSRQPTLIVSLLLPSLSLLFLAVTVIASAQYVVPCHFNPMCSCKMSQTSRLVESTDGYASEPESRNRTLNLAEETDGGRPQDAVVSSSPGDGPERESVFDVSCVGVPFAFLPGKRD